MSVYSDSSAAYRPAADELKKYLKVLCKLYCAHVEILILYSNIFACRKILNLQPGRPKQQLKQLSRR